MTTIKVSPRAKLRGNMAANMIKEKRWMDNSRFDDCFEQGDSNEVMEWIILKARTDRELATALKTDLPHFGYGESNVRMHEAIEECLTSIAK